MEFAGGVAGGQGPQWEQCSHTELGHGDLHPPAKTPQRETGKQEKAEKNRRDPSFWVQQPEQGRPHVFWGSLCRWQVSSNQSGSIRAWDSDAETPDCSK